MGSFNISIYVKNEDLAIYADNVEILNQKAREAFDKELGKIKESIANLELMNEDKIHQGIKLKHQKSGTWKKVR